jgi:hypothetical protein
MKKLLLILTCAMVTGGISSAQCTFEALFPLPWGASKFAINEHYQTSPYYQTSKDTIRGTSFEHGLNYFFMARNMNLESLGTHPCFKTGHVILNGIANDSGLVAYNFQVTFPATEKVAYFAVIDSMKAMMAKKFTYTSTVNTPTKSFDANGNVLTGEGVSVYFNNEPVVSNNLTYPQFVVRAGYLARKPEQNNSQHIVNQAENIEFYRLEILYKVAQPKW